MYMAKTCAKNISTVSGQKGKYYGWGIFFYQSSIFLRILIFVHHLWIVLGWVGVCIPIWSLGSPLRNGRALHTDSISCQGQTLDFGHGLEYEVGQWLP